MNGTAKLTVTHLELDGQVVIVTASDPTTGDTLRLRVQLTDAPRIGATLDLRLDQIEEPVS